MEIKPNDNKYTEQENKILESIKRDIITQLEKSSIATVYRGNLWHGESFHKTVGQEFRKAGYYVAYDYVPNGYRSMVVSKMPLGEPSERLVSRTFY